MQQHDEREPSVLRVLAAHLGVPLQDLEWDQRLTQDLGLDRFDLLELLDALEEAFSVSLPHETAPNLETVSDVVSFLRARGKLLAA